MELPDRLRIRNERNPCIWYLLMEIVGLRVRNKDRVVQIDGMYKNHALLKKQTVQPTESVFGDNSLRYVDIQIPPTKNLPLVALRSDFACFYTMVDINTIRVFTKRTPATDPPPQADVYIFGDPPAAAAPGSIGLRVRSNITGEVVYDSTYKYLRVLGHYVDTTASLDNPLKFPGKKVAVVQGVRSYGAFKDRSNFIVIDSIYSGVITTIGLDAVSYRYLLVRSFNLPWDGGSYPRYDFSSRANSFTVIDVTGY